MGEDKNPKETTESEVVSRRSFMRKAAEVAALSLFGVMGLDAVTDRVLERIAENQAMGRLSDSAAGALKQHRLDYYAGAQAPNCNTVYNGGVTCSPQASSDFACTVEDKLVVCVTFNPHCTPAYPFNCTAQLSLTCGTFTCNGANQAHACCPSEDGHFA